LKIGDRAEQAAADARLSSHRGEKIFDCIEPGSRGRDEVKVQRGAKQHFGMSKVA
jgi:hypothetical protein